MSSRQTHEQQVDLEMPETVETADAKLVYLYLSMETEATIDELQTALGMKKISLYSLLQTLTERDLVERTGGTYVCSEPALDGGHA